MKINKFAILGALALGLCTGAFAQTTDYTPVTFSLTGTYQVQIGTNQASWKKNGTVFQNGRWVLQAPTYIPGSPIMGNKTLTINNASILSKIASFANTNLAGYGLAIDNSSGALVVISGTNLLFDLSQFFPASPGNPGYPYYQDPSTFIQYWVHSTAPAISPALNDTAIITNGTSTFSTNTPAPGFPTPFFTYSVSGGIILNGFTINFLDDQFGTDYQLNITGGLGAFTSSLSGTNTYTQALNAKVIGTFQDSVNINQTIPVTGTITAAGGPSSFLQQPSIWDLINN